MENDDFGLKSLEIHTRLFLFFKHTKNGRKLEILYQVNYLPNHILMSRWYNYKSLKVTERNL